MPRDLFETGGAAIDLSRPRIPNPDGSFSTEETIGIEADGRHYNIPTIINGQRVSPDEAVRAWEQGRNPEVGVFGSRAEADAAAPQRSQAIGEMRGGRDLLGAPSFNDRAHVATGAFIEGVPVVGPYIREGADRLGAGLRSMYYDTPYQDELNFIQGRSQQLREEMPVTDTVSGVAGAIGGMVPVVAAAPAAFGVGSGPLLARTLASTGSGAAIGGADAAVRSDFDPQATAWGAGLGAGVGAVAPAASDAIGRALQRIQANRAVRKAANETGIRRDVPTAADIRASAGYGSLKGPLKAARLSGDTYRKVVGDLWDEAQDFGLTTDLKTQFGGTLRDHLKRAEASGGANLYDLDLLRRSIRNAGGNKMDDASQALASRLIDKLDDAVDGLSEASITGPSGKPLVETLKEARATYRVGKKAQMIEDAMMRAQNAASGVENGLRTEFRKILNTPRLRSNFTDAEITAIEQVTRGNFTTNALRFLGTFGFPVDQARNWLGALAGSSAAGAMAGSAFGPGIGTAVGAGVALGGTAAKYGASKLTQRAASLADRAVKTPEFSEAYFDRMRSAAYQRRLKEAIANALMRGTGLELESP